MTSPERQKNKSYAMRRMGQAIGRAIQCQSPDEQARAIRWVAAWGMLCGIRSSGVRLRPPELLAQD